MPVQNNRVIRPLIRLDIRRGMGSDCQHHQACRHKSAGKTPLPAQDGPPQRSRRGDPQGLYGGNKLETARNVRAKRTCRSKA
jgi:hypothetical protein